MKRVRSGFYITRRTRTMGGTFSVNSAVRATTAASSAPASSSSSGDQPAYNLPLDILEEIFLNLPPHRVVCVCRLVCRQWKDVADHESFWRERCRREGYHVHDASKVPSEWRLFYFLCKKRRNLLKNPRAEDELRGWTILLNGGNRWNVERPIVPHPKAVQSNFVTSYSLCIKSQTVDLKKEGYSPSFMDEFQPPITISDWYAPRCRCEYRISVQLLDRKNAVVQDFTPGIIYLPQFDEQIGEQWHQMIHVFKDYGPGVRYIKFSHGGQDQVFWSGWYGVRVTDSCVEICPALDT